MLFQSLKTPRTIERPDQIELLFDGQRPGVGQRRGERALVEVVRADRDEVPVGVVEERGERVASQVGYVPAGTTKAAKRATPSSMTNRAGRSRRAASGPEAPEADRPRSLPLGDQQRGDEEAREGEERVEGVETPRRQEDPAVVPHDDDDRHAPDAVECGDVGDVRSLAGRVGIDGAREARNVPSWFLFSSWIYHGLRSVLRRRVVGWAELMGASLSPDRAARSQPGQTIDWR